LNLHEGKKTTARCKAKSRNPGERTVRAAFQKQADLRQKNDWAKNVVFSPNHFFAHNAFVR
jgi:hypothetical protein